VVRADEDVVLVLEVEVEESVVEFDVEFDPKEKLVEDDEGVDAFVIKIALADVVVECVEFWLPSKSVEPKIRARITTTAIQVASTSCVGFKVESFSS
jgi:hypothetical protein